MCSEVYEVLWRYASYRTLVEYKITCHGNCIYMYHDNIHVALYSVYVYTYTSRPFQIEVGRNYSFPLAHDFAA